MGRHRKKPDYLNEKEFICLEKYLETGNQRVAGIEAGYSRKTAHVQACRLINSEKGQRYIGDRMYKADHERIANTNEVLEYLTRVMRGEEEDINFKTGQSQPIGIHERTVAGVELAKRLLDKGSTETLAIKIINDIPKISAEQGEQ